MGEKPKESQPESDPYVDKILDMHLRKENIKAFLASELVSDQIKGLQMQIDDLQVF